jgi:hypothetical protein
MLQIEKEKKTKIDQVEDYKSKIRGFEIQPESTILVESRGATDKGIATKAHYLSTPNACSCNIPWKLGPNIIIVKIRDHIVNNVVICIEPDQIFETWPPIYRG